MKTVIFFLTLFCSYTVFGQKLISYKYEKEVSGESVWGGRVVPSVKTVSKKIVQTVFLFNAQAKTVKLGDNKWEIILWEGDNLMLYRNNKSAKLNIFSNLDNDKSKDREILIEYFTGPSLRYYFKASNWIEPKI